MATGSATIIELRLEADGLSGRITCPPGLRPAPGQYLLGSGPEPYEPLPVVLFPSRIGSDDLELTPGLPPTWTAGMPLALRGPLGHGFRMPPSARRVALAGLEESPARLLPLVDQALAQHAAVAIYARRAPRGLPEEVEVLPMELLPEAHAWADFLALEARPSTLPDLNDRLGLKPFQHPGCMTQVLVITAMPCSGLADCGVCAVPTHAGWALTCSEGPVFDYSQLVGV